MADNEIKNCLVDMAKEHNGNFSGDVLDLINRYEAEIDRLKKYELLLFLTLCNSIAKEMECMSFTLWQSGVVAVVTMQEMLEMLDPVSARNLYEAAKEGAKNMK